MLLIHAGLDRVQLSHDGQTDFLPRTRLEREFPRHFFELLRQQKISQIFVINGPGSFTNLRVIFLTLQLAQHFDPALQIRSLPKRHLFAQLSEAQILNSPILLFAGPRAKLRHFDPAQPHDLSAVQNSAENSWENSSKFSPANPHRVAKSELTNFPTLPVEELAPEFRDSPLPNPKISRSCADTISCQIGEKSHDLGRLREIADPDATPRYDLAPTISSPKTPQKNPPQNSPQKILALDRGSRKIWLAHGQLPTGIPLPLGAIPNDTDFFPKFSQILAEHRPELLIVGRPRRAPQLHSKIQKFADTLRLSFPDLSIEFVGEDYSSVQAREKLGFSDRSIAVDVVSAMTILDRRFAQKYD